MSQTPFEAYQMFCAIRAHMTTDTYDFFRYQGKVRVTKAQFDKRNDKFHFEKLARLADNQLRTAVAFLEGATWIGDVTGELGHDSLIRHKKYIEQYSQHFKNDLKVIGVQQEKLAKILYPQSNIVPKPVQLFHAKKIGLETLVILDDKYKISKGWVLQFPADPLIKKTCKTIEKYRGFFSYNCEKTDKILVDWL